MFYSGIGRCWRSKTSHGYGQPVTGEWVETGSAISQKRTCLSVSLKTGWDGFEREEELGGVALPLLTVYRLLDYFTELIVRYKMGTPPVPHPIRRTIPLLQHLIHLFSILDAAISFP